MSQISKGFEIAFNIQEKILRLRAWGDWDAELGKKYGFALRSKLTEINANVHWKIWYVLVDLARVLSPPEEIRQSIEKHLTAANNHGIKRIAYLQNGTIPRLSVKHTKDGPAHSVFESADEALQWLLSE